MKQTIITAIVAFIVAALDLIKVFSGIDLGIGEENILAIVTVIVGAVCYWKNQSWTVEARTADRMMREMKATRLDLRSETDEPDDAEVKL